MSQSQEKLSSEVLNNYAKINYKQFLQLANQYYWQDIEYYNSTVKPILDHHEERRRKLNIGSNIVYNNSGYYNNQQAETPYVEKVAKRFYIFQNVAFTTIAIGCLLPIIFVIVFIIYYYISIRSALNH